jgi:hypothetical protein
VIKLFLDIHVFKLKNLNIENLIELKGRGNAKNW